MLDIALEVDTRASSYAYYIRFNPSYAGYCSGRRYNHLIEGCWQWVSILLMLDIALEVDSSFQSSSASRVVSILLMLDIALEVQPEELRRIKHITVSILLMLDIALEAEQRYFPEHQKL